VTEAIARAAHGHHRSTAVLHAAHTQALAPGAAARPGRKRIQRQHAGISAARSRPATVRPPAQGVSLTRTEGAHIAASSTTSGTQFQAARLGAYDIRPTGNAVNLEDEMIKGNQMDYQAVTTLYQRSLGLLKTAMGKR
jgi:hypothetical protein